jgi:hypothetical protein
MQADDAGAIMHGSCVMHVEAVLVAKLKLGIMSVVTWHLPRIVTTEQPFLLADPRNCGAAGAALWLRGSGCCLPAW